MKTTFIYALCEPGTDTIRYIGKTNDPKKRFMGHRTAAKTRKSHLACWLKKLAALDSKPEMQILDEVPYTQWEFWEREYIRVFRAIGFDLVNSADGGEGCNNPSSMTRQKISDAKKGEKNHQFGKPRTDKEKAAISAGLMGKKDSPEVREAKRVGKLGEKNPQFGKAQTEESNAKRRASMMGSKNPSFGKSIPWSEDRRARFEAKKALTSAGG